MHSVSRLPAPALALLLLLPLRCAGFDLLAAMRHTMRPPAVEAFDPWIGVGFGRLNASFHFGG